MDRISLAPHPGEGAETLTCPCPCQARWTMAASQAARFRAEAAGLPPLVIDAPNGARVTVPPLAVVLHGHGLKAD